MPQVLETMIQTYPPGNLILRQINQYLVQCTDYIASEKFLSSTSIQLNQKNFWMKNLRLCSIQNICEKQTSIYLSQYTIPRFALLVCPLLVMSFHPSYKWAATRENLSSGVYKQHRRRPWSSAQSDQLLVIRFLKSIIC